MYRKGALSTRQEHRSCVGKTATGARDRVKGKPTFIPRDLESSGNDASGIIRKGGKKKLLRFLCQSASDSDRPRLGRFAREEEGTHMARSFGFRKCSKQAKAKREVETPDLRAERTIT